MSGERRRHGRRVKLVKLVLEGPGGRTDVMTTDLSLGGAFVCTTVQPALETRVMLHQVPPDGAPTVTLHGVVRRHGARSISGIVGFAVEWLGATSPCETEPLREALMYLFNQDLDVKRVPGRGSAWASPTPRAVAPAPPPRAEPPPPAVRTVMVAPAPRAPRSLGADRRVPLDADVPVAVRFGKKTLATTVDEVGLRELWLQLREDVLPNGTSVVIDFQVPGVVGPTAAAVSGTVTGRQDGLDAGVVVRVVRIENRPPAVTYERWVASLALKHGRATGKRPRAP